MDSIFQEFKTPYQLFLKRPTSKLSKNLGGCLQSPPTHFGWLSCGKSPPDSTSTEPAVGTTRTPLASFSMVIALGGQSLLLQAVLLMF